MRRESRGGRLDRITEVTKEPKDGEVTEALVKEILKPGEPRSAECQAEARAPRRGEGECRRMTPRLRSTSPHKETESLQFSWERDGNCSFLAYLGVILRQSEKRRWPEGI